MDKKLYNNVIEISQRLFVPMLLLAAWDISLRINLIPNTLIASPVQVLIALIELIKSMQLLIHAGVSLYRLLFGFCFGSIMGVTFGVIIGYWKLGRKLFELTVSILMPIPPIAWIPLLIIIFGIGEASKIMLISLGSFFTLYINTVQGVRSCDSGILEVANILEKSDSIILKNVIIPSCIPSIIAGARVAMALSWTLLICSEVIASSKGLGWLIWNSRNFSRPDEMISGMIAVGVLGKLTDSLIILLGNYLTRHKKAFAGR